MNTTGLITMVANGSTTVTGTQDGVTSNTISVNVNAFIVTALSATPATVTVAVGGTQQMTCTASFDNGAVLLVTEASSWITVDAAIVTANNQGLVRGVAVGSSSITCQFQGVNGALIPVNVVP